MTGTTNMSAALVNNQLTITGGLDMSGRTISNIGTFGSVNFTVTNSAVTAMSGAVALAPIGSAPFVHANGKTYLAYKFDNPGTTYTISSAFPIQFDFIAVGGGGGGAGGLGRYSGGAGAGGLQTTTTFPGFTPNLTSQMVSGNIMLLPSVTGTINIGAGGNPGTHANSSAVTNGGNTSITIGATSITAYGGARGSYGVGVNGGCGGGGNEPGLAPGVGSQGYTGFVARGPGTQAYTSGGGGQAGNAVEDVNTGGGPGYLMTLKNATNTTVFTLSFGGGGAAFGDTPWSVQHGGYGGGGNSMNSWTQDSDYPRVVTRGINGGGGGSGWGAGGCRALGIIIFILSIIFMLLFLIII
jgi:hypothetical protein